MPEKKWRLLDYSVSDPRMNLAIEEAILRSRHEGLSDDTLRLWQNPNCVVLGHYESVEDDVDLNACKRHKVKVVRRTSGGGTVYQDLGNLNFTIVVSEKSFPLPKNLVDAYKLLYDGVLWAIRRLGVEATVDDERQRIFVKDRKISGVAQHFFYDLLLFHGTLLIDTNLTVLNEVLKHKKTAVTTIRNELGKSPQMEEIKSLLIQGFEKTLNVTLQKQNLSDFEQKIAKRLYDIKYSRKGWNFEMKAPLSLKGALVEVYVAYPPTSMCRQIVDLVNQVTADLQENVETKIWMRGLGCPPGATITHGLKKAAKENIIPAIIIDGEIAFGKSVPSEHELRETILKVLKKVE